MSAGEGSRYGNTKKRKQFLDLNGRSVLARSVGLFKNIEEVKKIVVVYPPDMKEVKVRNLSGIKDIKIKFVPGKKERTGSVKNGLKEVNSEYVMVHDSVRPGCTKDVLKRLTGKIESCDGVIPGLQPVSTLKYKDRKSIKTLDRSRVYIIQTPQLFKTEVLKKGYRQMDGNKFTDSSSVVQKSGYEVEIVEGSRKNIKITYPEDLEYLKGVLK
ncbi:MAG: 2-C-methyl-D-erythritol 4-phosphate cytidylyltransferase [Elusimicrobiota bacterium]